MTKQTLFVLCASLCLSFGLPVVGEATAQTPKREKKEGIRTASPARTSVDSLTGEHALLADRIEIKRRIADQKKLRDQEIQAELAEENLDDPAIDLYGENSWNSNVNPIGTFGSIPARYDINLNEFVMPIERRQITSRFGYRRRFRRMHYGIDLALSVGDTVRSAFSGKVRISSYEGRGYGHYIIVRHPNGLETVYGHLHRRFVKEGTVVKAGDPIGLGGNTGRSTGPHLHFEARFMGIPLNPDLLIDFIEGAPRMDVYTFRRGASQQSTYAARSASKKSRSATGAKDAIRTYRIKSGDSLTAIAKKHGVTVKQLCKLNGISANTTLRIGKSLRIS